jgi:hypothetical protein
MKKRDNLIDELVDKMLEKHGVNYEFVLANPFIEGESWFTHYTFTQEEAQEFKIWAIKRIKDTLKCSKIKAEREFDWFNLAVGLKVEQNENETGNEEVTKLLEGEMDRT